MASEGDLQREAEGGYTAIIGGNFDPPHIGHFFCAVNLLNHSLVREVWFVPAGDFRYDRRAYVSAKHRVNMLELALEEYGLTGLASINKIQLQGKDRCYTWDLLESLSVTYGEKKFAFAIGSDRVEDLRSWYNYEKIVKKYTFFIIPRSGVSFSLQREGKGLKAVYLEGAPSCSVSSSFLRKCFGEGALASPFLPVSVLNYIRENNLYS